MALGITIGMLIGFAFGFMCAALLCAASEADKRFEQRHFKRIEDTITPPRDN